MSVGRETVGVAVAAALTSLAAYLFPAPLDLEPVFKLSAVVSGLVGYWISRQTKVISLSLQSVLAISVVILALVPVLSIHYMHYLHLPTPRWWNDVSGFLGLEVLFAAVCFLLGLLFGNFLIGKPQENASDDAT